ncbi:MAG: DUF1343 domain-containing protein [Myxococcales bacterium]|nr:DUF1343 domain-containing protein [Myxococcales bacterium]
MTVHTGLDRVARGDQAVLSLIPREGVGLLAHAASVDRILRPAHTVLTAAGIEIGAFLGPEHGYASGAQDMVGVRESHTASGVPIYSLYGASEEDLYPKDEWLRDLSAVVIDLQDVGARYYTYVWTAAIVFERAARLGIPTVVLDRPNPLGGTVVEGAPQRHGYRSFVGYEDVAVRHGLTLAEILVMIADRHALDREGLRIVPMEGWRRDMFFPDTGLPWVLPSPNMPTFDTAAVYPGGCLLEGTNLSEGRGSTRPFEVWGAPFVDPEAIAESLVVDGAILRPLHFEPTFHKHAKKVCAGFQVHVTDVKRFRSYETYLKLIHAVFGQRRGAAWRTETYEFVSDRPAIDLLTGGPEFRSCVEDGSSLGPLLAREQAGAAAFDRSRDPWLLYPRDASFRNSP